MTEPTITCPKCKTEIKRTESLAPLLTCLRTARRQVESTRREFFLRSHASAWERRGKAETVI